MQRFKNDLISRQDAIDAVKSYWKAEVDAIPKDADFGAVTATCDLILKCNTEMCKVLDGIPSAETTDIYRSGYKDGKKRGKKDKRRKGKWIWDDEGYHCSLCGFHAHGNTLECLDGTYRYCPWCGARVSEGEENEKA